jgi:flavin reductase (DIM6/NTAB) family NADH-FMN oxidoreductase RutF
VDPAYFVCDTTDHRHLRQALGRFATGVTVVTTRSPEGRREGLTANSFAAVSLDPPLVLWSLRNSAPSLPSFLASGSFAVNVLAAHQSHLSRHFAFPRPEKFRDVASVDGRNGCPVLAEALAVFECATQTTIAGGDHTIFIGRVGHATYRDGDPLIFNSGKYCSSAELVRCRNDGTSDGQSAGTIKDLT